MGLSPLVASRAGRYPWPWRWPIPSDHEKRWVWWVILLLSLALGALPLLPPTPAGADAVAFSTERAMIHVDAIAQKPHPMGSEESIRVRDYIVSEMVDLGLTVEKQAFEVPDYFGTPGATVEAVNVIARLEGETPKGALLLVAHYDTVPATPGANDNSAAVAVLMESARALVSGTPLRNDVVFLFTDGEEPAPRFGATAFITSHPWFDDVVFVLNLEAIGNAGSSQLIEVSGSENLLIADLAASEPDPVAYSFITEFSDLIGGGGTDFTPFVDEGIPGLSFAYLHGSPIYHTEADSLSNVGLASLRHHGAHVLGLVHHFDDSDFSGIEAKSGANYFTFADWRVIRYPDAWAIPLSILSILTLGWALARKSRSGRLLRPVLTDTALALIAILGTTLVSALAWQTIASIRPQMVIVESYLYFLFLLGAAYWATAALLKRTTHRTGPNPVIGAIVIWAVLGVFTSLYAEGLSYLFVWPTIAGSLLVAYERSNLARFGVIATLGILWVPWIDFLLQMGQPRPGNPDSQLLPVTGLAVSLAVLAIVVIRKALLRRHASAEATP
ncbi:MAG: M28 family peptidase [Actinomycetota bacterium]|nr:M28 family peptidase [Actinomycetota bacterium]